MAEGARQPTAGPATRSSAAGPVPLRRNRDFMVLWSSQVVSTVGTRVTSIAFPLLVLAETHSPAKAGVVAFAQTLPFLLLYLPAGAFIDRWDRKRTMIACDAGPGVALGSIAITIALGWLSMAQVIVAALIEGSLFVLFDLTEGAVLPQLVTAGQLPAALAQNQAKTQGADVVGQPLGGVLFSTAWLLPFLVNAVSYLVSFTALLSIRRLGVAPAVPARCGRRHRRGELRLQRSHPGADRAHQGTGRLPGADRRDVRLSRGGRSAWLVRGAVGAAELPRPRHDRHGRLAVGRAWSPGVPSRWARCLAGPSPRHSAPRRHWSSSPAPWVGSRPQRRSQPDAPSASSPAMRALRE